MKNIKETILLRQLIEAGYASPSPTKIEYYTPHYEVIIGIGKNHTASILIDEESYFELLENSDYEVKE